MKNITLEELLEAGCHFGHQITRQNPKARDFVYGVKDGVQIIDLALTKKGLDEALAVVKQTAENKEATLLVVGTKRQAFPIILSVAEKVKLSLKEKNFPDGLFSVTTRWIGGTLTNFAEVKKNCKKLKDLQALFKDDFAKIKYTKKELLLMQRNVEKLNSFYGGVADMEKLPTLIFIVDAHMEETALREAHSMGIKTLGIVDTNADPTFINYIIPANDDAVGSLDLIISAVLDAWQEGRLNAKDEIEEVAIEAKSAEQIPATEKTVAKTSKVSSKNKEENPKKGN